jgi:hypothetical protein
MLGEFVLRDSGDLARVIEKHRARTGRTLVE